MICTGCGKFYEETGPFANGLCDGCDAIRVAEALRERQERDRAHRTKHWPNLDMPFADTDRARLPASRTAFVLKWRPNPQFVTGLVISGDTGMGKTRTVVELLRDIYIESGTPFEFCRVTEWRLRLDKAHRYGGRGVADLVRPLCRAPLLVMDDLGHGKWNEATLASLFEIIDARTSRSLPSIFTTQHTKDSLRLAFEKVSPQTSAALIRRLEDFTRLVVFEPQNGQ